MFQVPRHIFISGGCMDTLIFEVIRIYGEEGPCDGRVWSLTTCEDTGLRNAGTFPTAFSLSP